MSFEWDDNKEKQNIKKHGINFEIASRVFLDPNRVELYDEIHSIYEDRYHIIGMVHDILTVVYTQREESTRIISARAATNTERNIYYGNN